MGWHTILIAHILDLYEGPNKGAQLTLNKPSLFESGGTVNFWAMGIAGEYVRANRYGTDAEKRYINNRVRNGYFQSQRTSGHMSRGKTVEQTCCDPHYNFHAAAAAFVRLGAIEFGHTDVLVDSDEWWGWHIGLYRTCMAPNGEVVIPGMRNKGVPLNLVATALMREILELPHKGAMSKPGFFDKESNKVYYASVRMVRGMVAGLRKLVHEAENEFKVLKPLPNLALPMTVKRYPHGHVAELALVKGYKLLEPCNAIAVEYGVGGTMKFESNFTQDESYREFVTNKFSSKPKEMIVIE